MKRIMPLLVLALVALMLVPAIALAETPTNPGIPAGSRNATARGYNQASAIGRESIGWEKTGTGMLGYLTWDSPDYGITAGVPLQEVHYAQMGVNLAKDPDLAVEQKEGPHSNYTINTVKCATCHSVHMAPENSWLLTAATGGAASTKEVCALCHNALTGVTSKRVSIGPSGSVSNHTRAANPNGCSSSVLGEACHAGVHGVGVSEYDTLASKLMNGGADAFIDYALANPEKTGLTADYFSLADNGIDPVDKATFATSYLCSMCHQGSAFATVDGFSMMAVDVGNQTGLSA